MMGDTHDSGAARPTAPDPTPQSPFEFNDTAGAAESAIKGNLDLLLDVSIPVSVEVGTTQIPLNEILSLAPGSLVRLDKRAEDPIDLRVNGKLIARGEVVMVDDAYGLRITQIVDAAGRIESLR
jgi:flagellar motor switch protein FliN/FliY